MTTLFLASSHRAWDQITEVFDFMWPTATAMWNLRWQVAGYLTIRPDANKAELQGRFAAGSGITGANLQRACVEHSWSQQQEQFAKYLLTNLFAIYESWARDSLLELNVGNADQLSQGLQFPSGSQPQGVWDVVNVATTPESATLKVSLYGELTKHRKNTHPLLDNLLTCYRFFKECRNCQIHNGGIANIRAERRYQDFAAIATTAQLGTSRVPEHTPVINGEPIVIALSGVVTFCDILHRVIVTVDAELARSVLAEMALVKRWRKLYPTRITLRARDHVHRERQINRMFDNLQLPRPTTVAGIEPFLRQEGLIW